MRNLIFGTIVVFAIMLCMTLHVSAAVIKKELNLTMAKKTFPVPVYVELDGRGDVDGDDNGGGPGSDEYFPDEHLVFEDGFIKTRGNVRVRDAYTFDGKIPGPEIKAKVGDVLDLTVNNLLPPEEPPVTIHWHGIELDNQSDGTPVTETGIPPGKARRYLFRVTRPGVFWFHPHISTTDYIFAGMYAPLIVKAEAEEILEKKGVLPEDTKTIVLSDITVANKYNSKGNVFGFNVDPVADVEYFTPEELNTIPFASSDLTRNGLDNDCQLSAHECLVREGELVLVNGKVPSKREIETINLEEGGGIRLQVINSCVERFFRLRLLMDGDSPPFGPQQPYWGFDDDGFFGLCEGGDPLYCDSDIQPLYRVGGEGGLLDCVRLEGGITTNVNGFYDSVIRKGEELLAPADRTDVVIIAKDKEGNDLVAGDVLYLWTVDYPQGRWVAPDFNDTLTEVEREKYTNGDGDLRNRDIAARKLIKIKIVKKKRGNRFNIENFGEGLALRKNPYVYDPTESLKLLPITTLDSVPGGEMGMDHESLTFVNRTLANERFPTVNGIKGHYEGLGGITGNNVPTQGATRYAHIGDVLELVYVNTTVSSNHPFHLHGFSFQPVSIHNFEAEGGGSVNQSNAHFPVDLSDPVYTYPYNEFVDNINMQPNRALKFRVRLDDRAILDDITLLRKRDIPAYDPNDLGEDGGVGRWVFHCHITHHAGLGMISDLVVAPEYEEAKYGLIDIPDRNKEID